MELTDLNIEVKQEITKVSRVTMKLGHADATEARTVL